MSFSEYINRIGHLGIMVPDVDEAAEFYVNKLGFTFISRKLVIDPVDGSIVVAFVKLNNMLIELFMPVSLRNEVITRKNGVYDHFAIDCGNVEMEYQVLKEKGLKMTRQRLVVLEVLAENPEQHLTAEEIYERVKVENPDIGLATVYRTVQLLLELELIDRINLDDGFIRYEIGSIEEKEHHRYHHLICMRCGKVSAFQDDMLEALESGVREALGFQVIDHEVKLYGYCKDCLEKETNNRLQEERV